MHPCGKCELRVTKGANKNRSIQSTLLYSLRHTLVHLDDISHCRLHTETRVVMG